MFALLHIYTNWLVILLDLPSAEKSPQEDKQPNGIDSFTAKLLHFL